MLVMALEECDPTTGHGREGRHHAEGRGRAKPRPSPRSRSAEEGLLVSLDRKGEVDLAYIASLYGSRGGPRHRGAGRPHLPGPGHEDVADGRRLPLGERPGEARRRRSGGAGVRPERRGPAGRPARGRAPGRHRREPRGPVDSRRRRPGVRRRALRRAAVARSPSAHLKKDALWSVEAGYDAASSVAGHDRLRHGAGPTASRSSSWP